MTNQAANLLKDVRSHTYAHWTVESLVQATAQVLGRWSTVRSHDRDIIGEAVDVAVSEFEPSMPGSNEAEVRLCGEMALLSLVAAEAPSPYEESIFKAVIATVHLLVDVIGDYDSGQGYCKRVAEASSQHGLHRITILSIGDGGIATRRGGDAVGAIAPLAEAVKLSKTHGDNCSAARYSSELAISFSQLQRFDECRKALAAAKELAQECDDVDLQQQIEQNLSSVILH